MHFLERRAEEKTREAIERGELDDLPGAGKPLRFDPSYYVPEELKLAYKLLKDGGFLPPELELRKEVLTLKDLLTTVVEDEERYRIVREINARVLRLNLMRKRSFAHEDRQLYAGKLRDQMLEVLKQKQLRLEEMKGTISTFVEFSKGLVREVLAILR